MDPMTSHLEQLEAAERQLLVFAREINHLYQAERARAAELERALDRLRGSYLDMIKTLALVVEAKDPSTRAHLQRTHDYALRVPAPRRGQGRHPRVGAQQGGAP
jgi:response regulator RpfG family c-di-GMP phosphodiesterase